MEIANPRRQSFSTIQHLRDPRCFARAARLLGTRDSSSAFLEFIYILAVLNLVTTL